VSDQLTKALNNVRDANDLREVLLQTMASEGQIVRTRDDDFNNKLIRQPQAEGSLPVSNFKFEREVRFAESTGKRALLIKANSLADLDALQRQLTGER
jgi:hypothetical protein